jgi:putative tryptophan/tyrosine transport system substrate-binding protein
MQVDAFYASTDAEIEAAFAAMAQKRSQALLVAPDEFFTTRMESLAKLSLRDAIPTTYAISEFPKAGGLMSYGPDFANAYRETGIYTGRVLKRENPANLPIEQPTKFEFVINLKTAKALGITDPPSLLATADEVIE